ncbi:MAG: hypothetical protein HWE09_00155, partial [Cyclobacteriaceae bacterium]|nr:hypothetical protein [Cyclobacteriaceae bacterium]
MKITLRIPYFFLLVSLLLFGTHFPSSAQENLDIRTIQVDELSDQQIQELIRRANEAGLSTFEFLQMAEARGMSSLEVEKLRRRLEEL